MRSRLGFGRREALFTAGWAAAFMLMRMVNLPEAAGRAIEGILR
jgi:hypothetical protein